jgi:hypothetical protein
MQALLPVACKQAMDGLLDLMLFLAAMFVLRE